MKVFYSWQSDLPNATNRGLIGNALEMAATQIRNDESVDIEPAIDRDTLGLPGSPSIDEAIFGKISMANAYVADISIVNRNHLRLAAQGLSEEEQARLRPTPNPNVLLELGFAVGTLGWERIVLVFNLESGDPKIDLPFDLRQKRRIEYRSEPNDADRSIPKKKLAAVFEEAIRAIAKHSSSIVNSQATPSPLDLVIDSVENHSSKSRSDIRKCWNWLIDRLENEAPDEHALDSLGSNLDKVFEKTLPATIAFSRIAESVVLGREEDQQALWNGFDLLIQKYDLPKDFSGSCFSNQFDFWKLVGREWCLIFVGTFLKERQWKSVAIILEGQFFQRRWAEIGREGVADFRHLSDYPDSASDWNDFSNRRYSSPIGALFRGRYENSVGQNLLDWDTLCEADLILYLRGRFVQIKSSDWGGWHISTEVYMRSTPRFLMSAKSKKMADELRSVIGAPNISELKSFLKESFRELASPRAGYPFRYKISEEVIDAIGTAQY